MLIEEIVQITSPHRDSTFSLDIESQQVIHSGVNLFLETSTLTLKIVSIYHFKKSYGENLNLKVRSFVMCVLKLLN